MEEMTEIMMKNPELYNTFRGEVARANVVTNFGVEQILIKFMSEHAEEVNGLANSNEKSQEPTPHVSQRESQSSSSKWSQAMVTFPTTRVDPIALTKTTSSAANDTNSGTCSMPSVLSVVNWGKGRINAGKNRLQTGTTYNKNQARYAEIPKKILIGNETSSCKPEGSISSMEVSLEGRRRSSLQFDSIHSSTKTKAGSSMKNAEWGSIPQNAQRVFGNKYQFNDNKVSLLRAGNIEDIARDIKSKISNTGTSHNILKSAASSKSSILSRRDSGDSFTGMHILKRSDSQRLLDMSSRGYSGGKLILTWSKESIGSLSNSWKNSSEMLIDAASNVEYDLYPKRST